MKHILLLTLLLISNVCAQESEKLNGPYSISGLVKNYVSGKAIYIALYSSEEKFKSNKTYKTFRLEKEDLLTDSARYCFTDVEKGTYIVAAYQDLNNDKKLNLGMFGRPSEPYRFYRNYRGMRKPKFRDCSFTVTSQVDNADLDFGRK